MEYKKRFISKEAAVRLLLIAQSNTRNESLQASAGMALSHMVHLVITTNPMIIPTGTAQGDGTNTPTEGTPQGQIGVTGQLGGQPGGSSGGSSGGYSGTPSGPTGSHTFSSSRRLAGTGPLARVNASKGGTIRGESPTPIMTPGRDSPSKGVGSANYSAPSSKGDGVIAQDDVLEEAPPGSWAVFLSYVFEQEGAVAGILEALRDGTPKLQQAYLNILNMIFSDTKTDKISDDNSDYKSEGQSTRGISSPDSPGFVRGIDTAKLLLPVRELVIRPETVLPSLLRLIDQGGSSAVRAKALFAAQLLCRHSPPLLKGTAHGFLSFSFLFLSFPPFSFLIFPFPLFLPPLFSSPFLSCSTFPQLSFR